MNLTATAYVGEYSSDVVGKVTRCIFENGVSVPSQRNRTLRVTRYSKIRMIEKIVGFRSECNPHGLGQLEALLQPQVKFRECGAAQTVPSCGTELTGRWQRERARIEPARWSTNWTAVRTITHVRIANQVWSSPGTLSCAARALTFLKTGDTAKLIGTPPNLHDDEELQTRTLFQKCLGQSFVIAAAELFKEVPFPLARIEVGHVIGKQPWEQTIWVEQEYLQLEGTVTKAAQT